MTSKRTTAHAQSPSENWTDDLPFCKLSGVGFLTNQRYREDGGRREEHEFEDRSFHFNVENTYLYGVFDGHDGCRASDFAAQRLPAELLLGQLTDDMNDAQVRMALRQAFLAVEKGFFQSIDDALAEKTEIQLQLPEGLSSYEAFQNYPAEVARIQALQEEITGGTTAVVALIFKNKLYVANVGDSRALLCKETDGTLKVEQLTVDHDTNNESELLRLSQLGLEVIQIQRNRRIGNQENTRSIGDYCVKGGYKDFDILSFATEEPVIAEPHISGGYPIDESFYVLILMSDGVYKSLEDATGSANANADVTTIVTEELQGQATLNGVAQAVLDKIGRLHHDSFMEEFKKCQKRDDLTLLVRIFRQDLADNLKSPRIGAKKSAGLCPFSPGVLPVSVPYSAVGAQPTGTPSLVIPAQAQPAGISASGFGTPSSTTSTPTYATPGHQITVSSGTQSSTSSSANASPSTAVPPEQTPTNPETRAEKLSEVIGSDERDEGESHDDRVSPYVDFSCLFEKEKELGEKALYGFEAS